MSGRGSSGSGGSGRDTSAADKCGSGGSCGRHGILTGFKNTVIEVTGLGRRGCGVIQATALEKCAFEFAAEFPCWKNDKLQQQDVKSS